MKILKAMLEDENDVAIPNALREAGLTGCQIGELAEMLDINHRCMHVVALVLVGIIVSSSTLYYGFSVTGKVATLTDSMLDLTSEVGDLAGVMGDLAETVGEGIEDIAAIEDRILSLIHI